jgi:hypothetical protein
MTRLAKAFLLTVALAACTSTYKRETVVPSQKKLAVGGSVLVATPADAAYGDEKYPGSGAATATAVQAAFARHTNHSDVSAICADFDCMKSAGKPYELYAVPQILHWEDRATEWSGKKDKLEIKLTIYAPNGEVVGSNIISGKSKWATFGGDHPQDLLPEPVGEYVRSLF